MMRPYNPLEQRLESIQVRRFTRPIAGARTAVWTYGPHDSADTVLLVHGFRGTHHGLLGLVAAMPQVRFVAPDLPAFGDSEPLPGEHSLAGYATWLLELLRQLDPDGRMHVLGHSFGSMIVAKRADELAPRRITLVNPIAENALSGPERLGTAAAVGYYRLGALLPEWLGNALLRAPWLTRVMSEIMAVKRDRALRAWIHDEHHRHFSEFANRQALLEAFRASVSDAVRNHAAQLPASIHFVVGERDAIAPLDASRRLHADVPGSTLHIVQGVGHLIHYEAPLALARILRGVLAGSPY